MDVVPVTVHLQRSVSEAKRARALVEDVCDGLGADFVCTAQLLTSELVTNAVQHGSGRIRLELRRVPHGLRVDVIDQSPTEPVPPAQASPTSRGLRVVNAFADRWGVVPMHNAKSVWFSLHQPAAAPMPAPRAPSSAARTG
jgi:anti-sigma regulatory factor (Ser/Thr protein kinase)